MLARSIRLAVVVASCTAVVGTAQAQELEEAPASGYPVEIIERPFTLPQGAYQVGVDLFTNEGLDFIGLAVGGDYGLTDLFQVGAAYGISLKDFEAKGDIALRASYLYITGGKFEAMAVGSLGYSVLGSDPLPVTVGSLLWYRVADAIGVYSVPTVTVSLAETGGGPDVEGSRPIFLTVPVTGAFQITPNVHVEVSTNLATIEIVDSQTAIFGADGVPLSLTGFYSPSNILDVGAGLSWGSITDDAGSLGILVLARYRGGI